jgi:uncharacterized protein
MSLLATVFITILAFFTAMLSGIFGMAGGLVLMGGLALVLPVSAAFVTHGILQLVANGWRAILHRQHVNWKIVSLYAMGSLAAGVAMSQIAFAPSKPALFLFMGLLPGLLWLPKGWVQLDAAKPPQALLSGLMVTTVNLLAGVAGPLLDIFFVRTDMSRHAIVATKAATQVFAHLAKILVYGAPLLALQGEGLPPGWLFLLAIPLSMVGTAAGGVVLNRLSDVNFKHWTRLIVSAIGLCFLGQAAYLVWLA